MCIRDRKKGIQEVFKHIYDAGIKVKVITGDNAETTKTIAEKAGIKNASQTTTGREISHLDETKLQKVSEEKTLFTRRFPEAKRSVINALKNNGEVVARLGDGVNDGPALKASHIGCLLYTSRCV